MCDSTLALQLLILQVQRQSEDKKLPYIEHVQSPPWDRSKQNAAEEMTASAFRMWGEVRANGRGERMLGYPLKDESYLLVGNQEKAVKEKESYGSADAFKTFRRR